MPLLANLLRRQKPSPSKPAENFAPHADVRVESEDAQRKVREEANAIVRERRNALGQCVMCGSALPILQRLLRKQRHDQCTRFMGEMSALLRDAIAVKDDSTLSLEIGAYWMGGVGWSAGKWAVIVGGRGKYQVVRECEAIIQATKPSAGGARRIWEECLRHGLCDMDDRYSLAVSSEGVSYVKLGVRDVSKCVSFYGQYSFERELGEGRRPSLQEGSEDGAFRFVQLWRSIKEILEIRIRRQEPKRLTLRDVLIRRDIA